MIEYNNTASTSILAIVYLSVNNAEGQTVVPVLITTDSIPAVTNGEPGQGTAFIPLNNVLSRTCTGMIFATTTDGVPISVSTTVSISV